MKISTRLRLIAERLPQGCRFADIGSDHGLLPIYAMKQNIAASAIAGEVNDGPLDAARRGVAASGLQDQIAVRKGDGLAVIEAGEVNTITISGMGGALIASILSAGLDKLAGVNRLILQPNMAEEAVRRFLLSHNYLIVDEIVIEEDGKIYEIITADRHDDARKMNEALYENRVIGTHEAKMEVTASWLLELGPKLILDPNEVFFKKWDSEHKKLLHIYESIMKSSQPDNDRALQYKQKANELEEILRCLQKDKR